MIDTDPSGGDADAPDGGWAFVADCDGAAKVLDALLELDPDDTYTRSEVADRADVPLKTIYLNDLLDRYVQLGVLAEDTGGGESPTGKESQYEVRTNSPVFQAAASFDDAYRTSSE